MATEVQSPAPEIQASPSTTSLPADLKRLSRLSLTGIVLIGISLLGLLDVRLALVGLVGSGFGVGAIVCIRKYPDELSGKGLALSAILLGPIVLFGSIAFHQIMLRLEVPDGYELISWRELEPEESTPNLPLSERSKELSGQPVYLRGYVYPSTAKTNLKRFILVRDSGTCCFGGQPKLTDMIVVDFVNEKRINYSIWPRGIGGEFIVKQPEPDFSKLKLGAYYIKADHVK